MIYFLVNNDYQLIDALAHKFSCDIKFIVIPYRISEKEIAQIQPLNYCSPFKDRYDFLKIRKVSSLLKKIKYQLGSVNEGDVLFFYTEYDKLNLYIASIFKKQKAHVYLIEDGGFATYNQLALASSELRYDWRTYLRTQFCRYMYGMHYSREYIWSGRRFGRIIDNAIDGVIVYRKLNSIKRDMEVIKVDWPGDKAALNDEMKAGALYLNQDIYTAYSGEAGYFLYLSRALTALIDMHRMVYFKFHPRESLSWRRKIEKWIRENYSYDGVSILSDSSDPIERTISRLGINSIYSHSSSGCINLNYMGYRCGFLYEFDDIASSLGIFSAFSNWVSALTAPHEKFEKIKILNPYSSAGPTLEQMIMERLAILREN